MTEQSFGPPWPRQKDGVADHAAKPSLWTNLPFRTVTQGLATDLLVAVALVVYGAVSQDTVDWRLLGLTLLKTVLMTVASFVMKKLAPPHEAQAQPGDGTSA